MVWYWRSKCTSKLIKCQALGKPGNKLELKNVAYCKMSHRKDSEEKVMFAWAKITKCCKGSNINVIITETEIFWRKIWWVLRSKINLQPQEYQVLRKQSWKCLIPDWKMLQFSNVNNITVYLLRLGKCQSQRQQAWKCLIPDLKMINEEVNFLKKTLVYTKARFLR